MSVLLVYIQIFCFNLRKKNKIEKNISFHIIFLPFSHLFISVFFIIVIILRIIGGQSFYKSLSVRDKRLQE